MLIEYKVTFKKDSLTITQQINQDDTAGTAEPLVSGKALNASYPASTAAGVAAPNAGTSQAGGGVTDTPGKGGGSFGRGNAPITIIGPIFFGCPTHEEEDSDSTSEGSE